MRENDPMVINLRALDRGDSRAYLSMPARPGDVIFVPEAGEVMVQGWVTQTWKLQDHTRAHGPRRRRRCWRSDVRRRYWEFSLDSHH